MTEFILGKACVDVSARIRNKLIDEVSQGKKVVLVVPDQFEYETEKALYRACDKRGMTVQFANIAVRTFSKLSEEIILRYAPEKQPADDVTKNIMMYRAVCELKGELDAFGKIAQKPGFAPKMTGTVAMLKAAGIGAADFAQKTAAVREDFRDSHPSLFKKLGDIGKIYTMYDALLTAAYSDKLDSTATAARLAAQHRYFEGSSVYFDSFNDFSHSQMDFLYSVIDSADNTTFAFTTDVMREARDLFTTVNNTVSLLESYCRRIDKTAKGAFITICDYERFNCRAIGAISECIFSDKKTTVPMDGVRLVRADDVHNEADFIAAEIRRLTTQEGFRCSEIAVLCAKPQDYKTPLESAFEKYSLPLFCDIPESILHRPLVSLVLSLLSVLKSFTVENVLSYVKTGFVRKSEKEPLSMSDINDFESFIYEWDIRNDGLKEPFPAVDGRVPHAEELRLATVPPLLSLRERVKGCTGDEITKELCRFLFEELYIDTEIASHCKGEESTDELFKANEQLVAGYQKLWDTLLRIFESLYKGLSGYKLTTAEYCDLVRDVCSKTMLSDPPQVLDAVLVGDTKRTRIDGIKVVFIAGASYDSFPAEEPETSIFSEHELELLSDSTADMDESARLDLCMTRRQRYFYDRYLTYRALSIPSDRLYISYPTLDASCKKLSRSTVISDILQLFGKEECESTADMDYGFFCSSENAAKQLFAASCTKNTEQRATLKLALDNAGCADFTDRLTLLVRGRKDSYKHRLSPDTAEALFRSRTFSATSLERLSECRFEYFCRKGLRIKEPSSRGLNSAQIGNAVHYALQKILEKYCGTMDSFITLTRAQLSDEARHCLCEYKDKKLGGDYAKTLRFHYLLNNLTVVTADVLLMLQSEFAARDYRPMFFEVDIGKALTATSPAAGVHTALDITQVPDVSLVDDSAAATYNEAEGCPAADTTNSSGCTTATINTNALQVKLRDDLTINVTGQIDRVDFFTDENGSEYVRVVDYKTGGHEFNMVNVYYGINTQMLLYLIAVCDANPTLHAGGVSYLPAKIKGSRDTAANAFALLAKDHSQSGMYVKTAATEAEMTRYASTIAAKANIKTNPDSNARAVKAEQFMPTAENTLTEQGFCELRDALIDQTREVTGKLYDGDVDAIPTVYTEFGKEKKRCSYCRCKSICGQREEQQVYALPKTADHDDTDNNDKGGEP